MALVLEVLSGALVGGAMESKHASKNWGCLVAAIDPSLFGDRASFSKRVEQISKRVKGARKEEGGQDILLPGERGYREAGSNSSYQRPILQRSCGTVSTTTTCLSPQAALAKRPIWLPHLQLGAW